jgi:hypothetical protein
MIQRLKTIPFHVMGVALFFITHGYAEYTGLIPLTDLFMLLGVILAAAIVIFFFFKWPLKSSVKAGLFTTVLLLFYLFYGAIADTFKNLPLLGVLSRYRYLVPLFLILVVLLFYYFKRSKANFYKITLYLNTIFAVFIVYDLAVISINAVNISRNDALKPKTNQLASYKGNFDHRPDIYLIIMDEYCGTNLLKKFYNYDNHPFENFLREQGFWVAADPGCNYQLTVFSTASMLSMDYLPWLPKERKEKGNPEDFGTGFKIIASGNVPNLLQSKGYDIYNYSIFDVGSEPSQFNTGALPFKLKLITAKTFYNRMEKDLLWNILYMDDGNNWFAKRSQENIKKGNQKVMALTREAAAKKTSRPKFVYTHLYAPHDPFLYDSTGAEVTINVYNKHTPVSVHNKAYLQYFVYVTKMMRGFITDLIKKTNGEAVILLMSDHGYRGLRQNGAFVSADNNFNSVYLPNKDYSRYYDSITNVNQFRVLFNTLFKTNLPLLPDIR